MVKLSNVMLFASLLMSTLGRPNQTHQTFENLNRDPQAE